MFPVGTMPVVPSCPGYAHLSIEQIDQEITRLDKLIVGLKKKRNVQVPVAGLPLEILKEIFVLASHASRDDGAVGKTSLLITWVCSSWRNLAQHTPELWSFIDFIDPAWVETVLQRTNTYELNVLHVLPSGGNVDVDCLATLFPENLPRINNLSIHSSLGRGMLDVPLRLWATPTPRLKKLSLECMTLPSALSTGGLHTLQSLTLIGCSFSWDALPSSSLRELTVTNPISKVSAEVVVSKIQTMAANLEHLHLVNTLLPILQQTDPISSPQTRLCLRKLLTVEIVEFAIPVAFILDRFSLPASCHRARLTAQASRPLEHFALALAFVSSRGLARWPSTTLTVEVGNGRLDLSVVERSPLNSLKIGLIFVLDMPESLSANSMMSIFHIIPFSSIQFLTLAGSSQADDASNLVYYFHRQGGLRSLDVDISFAEAFSVIITKQNKHLRRIADLEGDNWDFEEMLDEESKSRAQCVISFHQLKTLRFVPAANGDMCLETRHLLAIHDWLMLRKMAGLEVETLIFKEITLVYEFNLQDFYTRVVEKFACIGCTTIEE